MENFMTAANTEGLDLVALEAVRPVASEYGIPTAQLKPCIAFLLDGNLPGGVASHKAAFTIAIELRRLEWTQEHVRVTLKHWAHKVDFRVSEINGTLRSAFAKKPSGEWKYHPPGLKKTKGVYAETLKPICDELGCPANCPAMATKYVGPAKETFEKFTELGWPSCLKKRRWRSEVEVYEAICRREKQLRLAPGVELFVTYEQLSELAVVHKTTVGKALTRLAELELISFEAGSGSGPHARDRKASKVARIVPIPLPPGSPMGALREGGQRQPHIGSRSLHPTAVPREYLSWSARSAFEPARPSEDSQ